MRLCEINPNQITITNGNIDQLMEVDVISSWIESLEYIDGDVYMTVLHNGKTYVIPDVPEETYEEWLIAISKGKFWWSDIKYIYTN